jgi:hypothetical protein
MPGVVTAARESDLNAVVLLGDGLPMEVVLGRRRVVDLCVQVVEQLLDETLLAFVLVFCFAVVPGQVGLVVLALLGKARVLVGAEVVEPMSFSVRG